MSFFYYDFFAFSTYVNIDFCFELANGNMGGIWNTFVVTKYDPILYTDMF